MAIHHIASMHGVLDSTGNLNWVTSSPLPSRFHKHFFKVYATTIKGNKLVPLTGGSMTIEASDNGVSFGSIHNGSINFNVDGTYDRPNILGAISTVRFKCDRVEALASKPDKHAIQIRIEIHSYN